MSTVFDAIKSRSSTRGYTDEKLTEDEIKKIVLAGLHAPTATNRQEIRFSVVYPFVGRSRAAIEPTQRPY